MSSESIKRTVRALVLTVLTLVTSVTQAAKPADKGGGGNTTEPAAAVDPPEIYWSSFNYIERILTIQGKDLITGDDTTPVLPQVYIGGELVDIDVANSVAATVFATNEGPLLIPLQNILDALGSPLPPINLGALAGGDTWEVKAVTSTGTALFSAYFPRTIKEVPLDIGTCPCVAEYVAYNKVDAVSEATFCSATQGISTDEYIEAGYGKSDGSAVIIGSHRSWSSESLYVSTCYARGLSQVVNGEEEPQYIPGSPIPVGDNDHLLCVAHIETAEPACVDP